MDNKRMINSNQRSKPKDNKEQRVFTLTPNILKIGVNIKIV
ncbi:MAG: hypothetical protein BMS9Abin11_0900 [Gammaproteobacteria bacterium]|nr:MAG: hypothetical protein BMS9Abin11_0900 [Gammaproteobacteria bacterium]